MDVNAADPPRVGIGTWGSSLSGPAVEMGARACATEFDAFHLNAPRIIPATRTTVTAQLITLKRFWLKNDVSLDIPVHLCRCEGVPFDAPRASLPVHERLLHDTEHHSQRYLITNLFQGFQGIPDCSGRGRGG